MGYGLGRGQGTLSFPFCAVYTSRWPRACPWAGSLGIPSRLSLLPAWGGPSPSLAATIALSPRAEAHVEALRIADAEVGSPPETVPSSALVYGWGGQGPGSRGTGGLDPGGLRLALPTSQVLRHHSPYGYLLYNLTTFYLSISVYLYVLSCYISVLFITYIFFLFKKYVIGLSILRNTTAQL